MTIHQTAAQIAQESTRIAAMAQTSNAECIRMSARIRELTNALELASHDIVLMLPFVRHKSEQCADSYLDDLRSINAILAKGN